jgi:uncharacterized protein YjbI with pentapeptide repeats
MRNLLNQIIEEVVYRASWQNLFKWNYFLKIFLTVDFINVNLKISYSILWYFVNLSSLGAEISNCQILGSDLTRVEFGNTSFTSCEFKQVDLSGSLFTNAQFRANLKKFFW